MPRRRARLDRSEKALPADEPGSGSADRAAMLAQGCWLCQRPLGRRVQWHHPVPKSRGGRNTVPIHPICHAKLHVRFSNRELADHATDVAALRDDPEIAVFLRWIAGKPADFHAPTRRGRP